jgi:hypothetical protein
VADVALVHAGQVRGRNLLAAPSDVLLPERLRQLAAATVASFSDATPEDDRPAASATAAASSAAAATAAATAAASSATPADASSATASPAAATASPATWLGAETRPCSQRGC